MSEMEDWTFEDVVGAVALAVEGGKTHPDTVALIEGILERGPEVPGENTGSLALLLRTVRAVGGRFEVAP